MASWNDAMLIIAEPPSINTPLSLPSVPFTSSRPVWQAAQVRPTIAVGSLIGGSA